jgi:crotonobetainyl-CoA:carnitine CoA-transferase CaiB-like acyl-CoA transferase
MAEPIGPLSGVRVLDFTRQLAGAGGTRVLANFGAEVLRAEWPHYPALDHLRLRGPYKPGQSGMSASAYFNDTNADKRSFTLNTRHPESKALLSELIAICDVVAENFTPGTMQGWGFGYEEMRAINPRIIYVAESGFGGSGPYAAYRSYGPTAQAFSSLSGMSGLPDRPPAGWGFSYLDHMGGYLLAAAVLLALNHRTRSGRGQFVDLSQAQIGCTLTGPAILDVTANGRGAADAGYPLGNRASHPRVAPHNSYRCAGQPGLEGSSLAVDAVAHRGSGSSTPASIASPAKQGPGGGAPRSVADRGSGRSPERASQTSNDEWIVIVCRTDEEWRSLCRAMGAPTWAEDERFRSNLDRLANEEALDAAIEAWTRTREKHALMQRLQAAGVPAAAVATAKDRLEHDPQLAARSAFVPLDHPVTGLQRAAGTPAHFSATPVQPQRPAPCIGGDNGYVYGELLHRSPAEVQQLSEAGAI